MWLLILLFLLLTLLLGWVLFGYFLFLWVKGRFRHQPTPKVPDSLPTISIIVPCFNEATQVLEKLDDIRQIEYPYANLEVVFADGGSTDDTVELLEKAIREGEPFSIVNCPRSGKINQLNHVLPLLKGEIIVNTDADARVAPDLLKWFAAEFAVSPNVGVVGAYCRPVDGLDVENYYWAAQNKGRFMENDAGSSFIVIAQSYGFRKNLVTDFPEDVVADDVYVAFLANAAGYKTVYSRLATAVETRTPSSYQEFLPHKFRKSNAFLRETLRFVYLLPEMSPFCKLVFLTRASQQLLLPWLMLGWTTLALVLLSLFQWDVLFIGISFIVVLFIATNRVFSWIELPDGRHSYSFSTVVKGYVLTNIIMLGTGVSYPFVKQGSSYARIGQK